MEDFNIEVENDEFVDVETPDFDGEMVSADIETPFVASTSQKTCDEEEDQLPEEIIGKLPKADYDSIGEFCFESDQLALKGNNDYKNLLEAMVVLEAQRAKAVKDLEKLKKMQEEALSDPFDFLERLKRKENLNFPSPQTIYPIPAIDWSKYALGGNPSAFCQRQLARISATIAQDSPKSTKIQLHSSVDDSVLSKKTLPWTLTEENYLKELLLEFPPEDNKASRWEKIAACLENRTPFEVATRVHRYYVSLLGTGEKCPDELPDLKYLREHWQVPEVEEENEITHCYGTEKDTVDSRINNMDDEDISSELQDTSEFQELILLKKALKEKLASGNLLHHIGYKCCRCKAEPIVGVRWHCIDCKPPLAINLCNDCSKSHYETALHRADHQLEKHTSKEFLDRDYMQFLGNSDYNYLDPNYMPAT